MSRFTLFAVLAVAVVCVQPAAAMFEENESGVRAEGMGTAFTAIADDAGAVDFNPAGLFQLEDIQVVAFGKLLYGGAGVNLHTAHVAAAIPVRKLGAFGLRLQETGYELSSQRSMKLAHGFRLADGLAFGYGLNAYNLTQQDFGQGFALGVDAGMFGRIYRTWTVGFYAHNLNMPKMGGSDLPRVLAFGLGFSPAPGIVSAVDVSKEPGLGTRLAIGQEFRIIEQFLTARAGVQTEPVRLSFGLSSGYGPVQLDYALRTHPSLPLTHNAGISVSF